MKRLILFIISLILLLSNCYSEKQFDKIDRLKRKYDSLIEVKNRMLYEGKSSWEISELYKEINATKDSLDEALKELY